MEFKSLTNLHEPHKFAEGGFKKTFDVYEDIINPKTGKLETKKTKEEPFYEKIQAAKDSQILENIIQRYNIDLNNKHITEINEEIVDMTKMPEDLIETYALTTKLQTMFNETTAEIKNHFKDFAGFLQSFQKGTLKSELAELHKPKAKPTQQVQPVKQQAQPTQQVQQAQPVQQPTQQVLPVQEIMQQSEMLRMKEGGEV